MPRRKKTEEVESVDVTETIDAADAAAVAQQDEEVVEKKVKLKRKVAFGNTDNAKSKAKDSKKIEREAMKRELLAKLGVGGALRKAHEIDRTFLPVPWIAMQYVIGNIGIPVQTLTDIVGSDSLGKSSLAYALLAYWARHGCKCLYINTEAKMLKKRRIIGRLSGVSKEDARMSSENIEVQEELSTYEDIDRYMRAWAKAEREIMATPMSTPLIVLIDSITAPVVGKYSLVDEEAEKKGEVKGIDDVTEKMCAAANWLHRWCRELKPFLEKNNVTVLTTSSRNQDMGLIKKAEKNNRIKRGGEAINQKAAMQLSLAHAPKKSAPDKHTQAVLMSMLKNSYGDKDNEITYIFKNDNANFGDTDSFTGQAIDMNGALCNLLLDLELFGLTCYKKKYSSEELGVYQLTADAMCEKIESDDELLYKVVTALGIDGYDCE